MIAVLVAAIAGFLWPALSGLPRGYYTAADLTQDYALTRIDAGYSIQNRLLGDTVLEMQPWLLFNRGELRKGELPLWNPFNGCGVPHLSNYQSAVFSPFSLPFYVLGLQWALLAAAAMKLGALALFTFLFLRELCLSRPAALFGALAFAFSGLNVLLLGYPHSGVHAALPAALFFVERAVQRSESGAGARSLAGPALGLCLSLTLGLYAGHPEPMAFVVLVAASWALLRLFQLARARGVSGALRLGGLLCACGLVALGLAMPQILPFLEHVQQSGVLLHRQPVIQPSLVDYWPLLAFPNALGGPLPGWAVAAGVPYPNYEQVNSSYPGFLIAVFAALGIALAREDVRARFFALAVIVWIAVTSNLAGIGRLYDQTSLLASCAPLARSQSVWIFGLSVLAALALDRVWRRERPLGRFAAIAFLAAAALAVVIARARSAVLLDEHIAAVEARFRESVLARIEGEALQIVVASAVGLAGAALLCFVRARAVRTAGLLALVTAAYFQTALLLLDYNPTVDERFVYPRPAAMQTLHRTVGDARMVVLTENGLPPQTNMVYRLATPQMYDALGLQRYEYLHSLALGAGGSWREAKRADWKALAMFGIEFVLTAGEWAPLGTGLGDRLFAISARYEPIEVVPGREVRQYFTCPRDGLRSIAIAASVRRMGSARDSDLRLRLFDAHGELVAERAFQPAELRRACFTAGDISLAREVFAPRLGWEMTWAQLDFEPRTDALDARYQLVVDAGRGADRDCTSVWASDDLGLRGGSLTVDGELRAGATLLFDFAWEQNCVVPVGRAANLAVQHFERGLGPYFSVSHGVRVERSKQALLLMGRPEFDPYRTVVLQTNPRSVDEDDPRDAQVRLSGLASIEEEMANGAPARKARILERAPNRVVLEVERDVPGYLVAAQPYYPGWKATVNGEHAPILCANFAFTAVEVPAGTNRVTLQFDPLSFRLGLRIALASAVALTILVIALATRRRPSG